MTETRFLTACTTGDSIITTTKKYRKFLQVVPGFYNSSRKTNSNYNSEVSTSVLIKGYW
jgi:hypothetical protein